MIGKFTIDSRNGKFHLKDFDPADTAGLTKNAVVAEYAVLQERVAELQDKFYASRRFGLLIVLQGMDCSGKDGTVKNAMTNLNPSGFMVEDFKVPTPEESGHDYLWRIHRKTPMRGDITVFNRSYYEDVLVTRVHGLIDDETTQRRFKEIREFERYLVDNQTIVLKFLLHISKDFQKEKLLSRLENPDKFWKFSESDLKERQHWDEYQSCYEDVLNHCSTDCAPWHIVPADHRWFRDYLVLKVLVKTLEDLDLAYPVPSENIKALIREVVTSQ
jgi:PPK2 family polyphosphate:nucleotide phosphotransferase